MQDHLAMAHFWIWFNEILPNSKPFKCPIKEFNYEAKDTKGILRHCILDGV